MKNTYISFLILLISTTAFTATVQTVRTASKITEYYTKKGSTTGLKYDRTVIEIGNRLEDQSPNEHSVQTKILTMKNKPTRSNQLKLVKLNAEKIGNFKIDNVDETRYSDKHCTTTPKEKICHSSIDLEMTVQITQPKEIKL
jgi:hypothetical protein